MVDSLVAVSAALIAATGCLAFVTASALFGARIFRWLHPEGPEHPVHSLVAIAIGLGALAHTTLALGLAGLLNRWALLALLAGFALAGRREFGPLYRSLREVCLSAVRTDLVTKVIAAILLIHVLAYIVVGLVPITGADAVKFYVTFPKRYVEDGSIHHIGPHTHSGTPQSGSMFYAVAMAAVNREAAALVPPFFLAATILLIVAIGARLDRPRAGWAAAALFACCPGVSTA